MKHQLKDKMLITVLFLDVKTELSSTYNSHSLYFSEKSSVKNHKCASHPEKLKCPCWQGDMPWRGHCSLVHYGKTWKPPTGSLTRVQTKKKKIMIYSYNWIWCNSKNEWIGISSMSINKCKQEYYFTELKTFTSSMMTGIWS